MTRKVLVAALCLGVAGCAARQSTVAWTPRRAFTGLDRQEIRELANAVGFSDIASVHAIGIRPSGGLYHEARSAITVSGHKLTWSTLRVCDVDDAPMGDTGLFWCDHQARGAPMVRVGCWFTSTGLVGREERWRITDNAWQVEVEPGPGVEYDVVVQIVLAIRRKVLVNRLWEDNAIMKRLQGQVPDVDASEITSIRRSPAPDIGFEVRTGTGISGYTLQVRVIGATVELHRYGRWIV